MTGTLITYDNTTDVFAVDGGPAGTAPGTPGGRIRAVLAPRGAASASAPARPQVPAAQLRPSTNLGGDKQ